MSVEEIVEKRPEILNLKRKQKTLAKAASYSGIGIHTGQEVQMRIVPAKEGSGIFFKRTDLPSQPIIPATLDHVFDTSRSTNIGIKDVKIYTVEHVLAAIRAYEIDNVCIELSSVEPPAGNGSSDVFVECIEQAGIVEQQRDVEIIKITQPIAYSDGEVHIVVIPSDEYRVSYTLHYPKTAALQTQYYSYVVRPDTFKEEIAPCRTFALYDEISYLMDKGLIRGGSLDNAVVIKDDAIISKNGLFFPNEMARHKILDLIGDVALMGVPFVGHVIAIRSGHRTNCAFAKKLLNTLVVG